jgi:aspartate-semialdehyde dehydrogenase
MVEQDLKARPKPNGVSLAVGSKRASPVKRPFSIAIVGATGVVGREAIQILEERRFPCAKLRLFASARSAGERIELGEHEIVVEELKPGVLAGAELVFLAAGGKISKELLPEIQRVNAVAIDKSSAFRMDPDVPLVVPEVNGEQIARFAKKRIIATPNCSTIQLVQVLAPLHRAAGIERCVVATYQAVSGAGKAGLDELDAQVRALFNFQDPKIDVFSQRIAFNALPCIPGKNAFDADGDSGEERKMIDETRKILGAPDLRVSATCVRVPVFHAHSEAVHLELAKPLSVAEVRDLLSAEPNVLVVDDPTRDLYPSALDAAGQDQTLVGRVRADPGGKNGIALWIVSDNLRTGAALNAVRIAEQLCSEHLA